MRLGDLDGTLCSLGLDVVIGAVFLPSSRSYRLHLSLSRFDERQTTQNLYFLSHQYSCVSKNRGADPQNETCLPRRRRMQARGPSGPVPRFTPTHKRRREHVLLLNGTPHWNDECGMMVCFRQDCMKSLSGNGILGCPIEPKKATADDIQNCATQGTAGDSERAFRAMAKAENFILAITLFSFALHEQE